MGDIADEHVANFESGRWGVRVPKPRSYPTTTRGALRDKRFSIVEVTGGHTNRIPGTKLVVCERDEESYWVWASKGVSGIGRNVCRVIESDMSIDTALQRRKELFPLKQGRPRPQPAPARQEVVRYTPICPYCNQEAKLVTGREVYPHRPDLAEKKIWQCSPCDAYVGCHDEGHGFGDGTRPMGRLANAELRRAKVTCHSWLDKLWLDAPDRRSARSSTYKWLARELGIPAERCHIGEFDLTECQRATEIARAEVARRAALTET